MWTSEKFHTQKISMKVKTYSKVSSNNVLSVDLWEIPHLENIDGRSKLLKSFIEMILSMRPMKNSTLRKISMKDRTSQGFHRKCNQVWTCKKFHTKKISMEDRTSQGFHRNVCQVCRPLKNFTLRKCRWKTKLLKGFIENVLSVDLWKIPRFLKISMKDPNFSRVSSKMY